jgi:hypothetical protein
MDAPTAAAIGSLCGVAIAIVQLLVLIETRRQVTKVKDVALDNSQRVNTLIRATVLSTSAQGTPPPASSTQ